jgi:hypothetical protein
VRSLNTTLDAGDILLMQKLMVGYEKSLTGKIKR